jgi:hypothetical protein
MSQTHSRNETETGADHGKGSKEVENVQCWDGCCLGLVRRASVWTDCPVIHIQQRVEELLSEEGSVIGLMKVDSVCRENAC